MLQLNISQSNKVCLTPEMQQGIKILSMSSDEVNDEIDNVLYNNVLLQSSINKNHSTSHDDISTNKTSDFFDNIQHKTTLKENLREQLNLHSCSLSLKALCLVIIECINDDGYFIESEAEISEDEMRMPLKIIQSFEPSGVAGRNLGEVLLIQARDRNWMLEMDIINQGIELIAMEDFKTLSKTLKKSPAEIENAIGRIRMLNPKPGVSYAKPDLVMIPDACIIGNNGKIEIEVYDNIKSISIVKNAKSIVNNDSIRESLLEAKSLINGINYRQNTLNLVLNSIAKYQKEFFLNDEYSLKPMTMSEIADRCGVHESTVSRVSASKYIQTRHGIMKLKDFFCSSIKLESGEISSRSVKKMIKDIISEEIVTKPISDMGITNELNDAGVLISRRTVAKYRIQMDIPNSSDRVIKLIK